MLCVATASYYMALGHLAEVGLGGLTLWVIPGLAAVSLYLLYRDRARTTARRVLILDAVWATSFVLLAPFSAYYFAPAALGLWIAVIAVYVA